MLPKHPHVSRHGIAVSSGSGDVVVVGQAGLGLVTGQDILDLLVA